MPPIETITRPYRNRISVSVPKEYSAYSFQVILVPCNVTPRPSAAADIHIFDSLHTDWGGAGSAEEIAASIRDSRHTDR